ncbi:hypothetical protein AHMF7605_01705 [Adhaeribacter arboris]|uniref:eCIS core domain-containing protein n=1 Tax=Adhaeribacter arboris TaxID=2072846 RepID=A0A2T2Y9Y9_9BACT|nr:DUF4157 domain-containing protein [Adhaeribacter arboris]PSR52325.1 hypothetical protein AHMF7605_01705 [Adhaeribacter arboris]
MKLAYARRYRRPVSRSRETAKKDNQQEPAFFAAPSPQSFFKPNAALQRKCDHCAAEDKKVRRQTDVKEEKKLQKMSDKKEEEKKLQKMTDKKEEEKKIQKVEEKKEEKKLQKQDEKKEEKTLAKKNEAPEEKKLDKKESNTSTTALAQTSNYVASLGSKGSALPAETQQFFAQRMGYDFSQVRIHTNTEAEQSAKDMNAKAYAVDNHVVFNQGQYNPNSQAGKKLLAHELTHVVQQKNNNQELVSRATEKALNRMAESQTSSSNGKATNTPNKIAYGCEGVEVEGKTEANYTDSYTSTGTTTPSTKCEDCPDDCVSANGNVLSDFKANPVVTLPDVPDGLSECETKAVAKFINTTLKNHELKHVAAFKTYNGKVKTPYKYLGCQSGLDAHIQSIHEDLNTKRTEAANAKSDKLDPFHPTIPCKCDE